VSPLPTSLRFTLFAAALSLGCHSFDAALAPPGANGPSHSPDEPPPLHTGGLDVAVSGPDGAQGPGSDPASHGDPTAAALATGIGIGVLGAGAAATVVACSQPGATEGCLRGPGPFEAPPPAPSAAGPGPVATGAPPVSPPATLIPGTCLQDTDCARGARCLRESAVGPAPKNERYGGSYCSTDADGCDPRSDAPSCGPDAACVYSHTSRRWACLQGVARVAP